MDARDVVFELLNHYLNVQEEKGKSFSHTDEKWYSIVGFYLGMAVRRVFAGEPANYTLIAKGLAAGVAWLIARVDDGWEPETLAD
jgi:hypothetical protein